MARLALERVGFAGLLSRRRMSRRLLGAAAGFGAEEPPPLPSASARCDRIRGTSASVISTWRGLEPS